MGAVATGFSDAFADGQPVSKRSVRALGATLETAISSAGVGLLRYATKAAMDAVTSSADGQLALVFRDPTPANNKAWQWNDGGNAWEAADWYFDAVTEAAAEAISEATDSLQFSAGNILERATPALQFLNGADALPGSDWGVRYPNGTTGTDANILVKLPFDGAAREGATVRLEVGLEVSATFTRNLTFLFYVTLNGTTTTSRTATVTPLDVTGTSRRYRVEYEVEGDELGLWPFVLTAAGAATSTIESVEVTDLRLYYLSSGGDFGTGGDVMFDELRGDLLASAALGAIVAPNSIFARTVTVKTSGGDYTHPKLAIDAITGATAGSPVAVAIFPGTYSGQLDWHTKDHVHLIGVGRRQDIVVHGENLDSASAGDISSKSLLWHDTDTTIANLTLTVRNGRYVIHQETSAGKPFCRQAVVNCDVRHLGNADAVNNTWPVTSQLAIGAGTSEGQNIVVRDSRCEGPGGGYSYHTPNLPGGYDVPCHVLLEGNEFAATVAGNPSVIIVPITVGAGDTCRMVGNSLSGNILYETSQWVSADVATPRDQIEVHGYGNTPTLFKRVIDGPAEGDLVRPHFTDEEHVRQNATSTDIPIGKVLAHDGDPRFVRLMTSSDPAYKYAGISWEEIPGDGSGRVKTGGWAELGEDVFFTGSVPTFGQTCSIDPTTPGRLVAGGSLGILPVVYSVAGILGVRVG